MKIQPSWRTETFDGTISQLQTQALLDYNTPGGDIDRRVIRALGRTLDPLDEWTTYYCTVYSKRYNAIVVFRDNLGGMNTKGEHRDGSYPGDTPAIFLGKILEIADHECVMIGGQNPVTGGTWQQVITKPEFEKYISEEE